MLKKVYEHVANVALMYCFIIVMSIGISVLTEPAYIVLLVICVLAEVIKEVRIAHKKKEREND